MVDSWHQASRHAYPASNADSLTTSGRVLGPVASHWPGGHRNSQMLDAVARRQFIRYGLVGLSVNVIGYFAFLGMVYAGLHHQLAATLMFAIAVLASYTANRNWSFGHRGGVGRTFLSYLVLYSVAWILDVLILFVFVDSLGLHHAPVQAFAILGIAGLLFIGQRYWVFRSSRTDNPSDLTT